jgi:integrase
MPTLKQNHRQILAAKAINGKRTRYRIEGVDGLWLHVGPSGQKTWYVRYQPGGRKGRVFRQYTLGDIKSVGLKDAALAAHDIVHAVKVDNRDPVAERQEKIHDALTFGDIFADWYERHAKPKLARHETDMTHFRNHIKGAFAQTRIADLKRIEIARYRDKVASKASPLVSNEVLMLINRVLYWAMDEGLIDANPAARLRRAGKRKPRERILTDADIPKFWDALATKETMTGEHMAHCDKGRMLSPQTRSILRVLLLMAQRRGEVAGAMKSEMELDGRNPVWTISGDRTKNGLLHRVPLCPLAKAEFAKAMAASPEKSPYVFPSPDDPLEQHISANAVTRAMSRLVAELKIPKVSPHDLRRTVGTQMAKLRVPLHVRSLVLNHSPQSRGVTDAVYNRYAYDKEKREALTIWERCLAKLTASKKHSSIRRCGSANLSKVPVAANPAGPRVDQALPHYTG